MYWRVGSARAEARLPPKHDGCLVFSRWAREIAAGDGVHPNEGGYAVIGDAVENWAGWRAWIDRAASS